MVVGKNNPKVRFANSTEESFGRLLHRLRLRWQYEPHTFILRTKPDGSPALGFTPDFYLPDVGIYFELTTLRQKLVTAKNRKVRLLAEQRPDVRLRLLYRHDCQDVLRPLRSRKGREARLRKLIPSPPEEVVRRAGWCSLLQRTGDGAGRVIVMGVKLSLGPEWAGRRLQVWVYPGWLEIEADGVTVARFPCSYDPQDRALVWVEPGELLLAPEVEQGRLALPELAGIQTPGARLRRTSYTFAPATQLRLEL